MGIRVNEDLIEEVRRNNDIVEVISEYINLKRTGKNYQGLCPFHSEKTPSFSVNIDKQLFHCFGCKAGGNVFNFLMQIENIGFYESVELLAKRAGISLPEKEEDKVKSEKDILYETNLLANRYFHYLLLQSKAGQQTKDYLEERGITRDTIEKFRLGYAANSWDGVLRTLGKRGLSPQILEKAGLVVSRQQKDGYYDRFRDRLIFPILDLRGRVLGFGGRILGNGNLPKYLNSPETIIFSKSKNLYGLYYSQSKIREKKQAIIVEGYIDFLTLYQAGIENVVASLGTALTTEQAKLLARYAEEVIVAYDGDLAGEEATARGLEILQAQGLKVRVLNLPSGNDPDSFLREKGKESLLALLTTSLPWVDYNVEKILARYTGVKENKGEIVERILPILSKIRNQVERDEYVRFLAEKLAVREETFRLELRRFSRSLEKGKLRNREEKIRNNNNDWSISSPSLRAEKTLLNLILKNEKVALWSLEVLSPEDFLDENYKRIFSLIGELINTVDLDWASWVEGLDDARLKEAILALLVEELPENDEVEPEKIASDCLDLIKKYQFEQKINQLQLEIKQAEERGEYTRVHTLLDECQELIRRRREFAKE